MSNSRFFAFGCSYTYWIHNPTWADFIGINYDKYYNFGKPGASNNYIMQKLIEADEVHNFNVDTDYIMVALTGFGRFTYLEIPDKGGYSWITTGDILFPNEEHPTKAKLIRNEIYNWPWAAYDSWIATTIIKKLLTLKGIQHKIIMALDNSHYIDDAYTLGLGHEFDNIGHIVPKIKNMYNILDIKEPIEVYRKNNMQTLYLDDDLGKHPNGRIYYDYCLKHMPELLSDKSLDLLNTPDEIWKSKFNNLI
jgi:hypothetical protein